MADHMRAELVVDALQMGLARRKPDAGLIHHSDQDRNTYLLPSASGPATPGLQRRWAPKATV